MNSASKADHYMKELVDAERNKDSSLSVVSAFHQVRDRQLSEEEMIYVDGWFFAPIEIAVIKLLETVHDI